MGQIIRDAVAAGFLSGGGPRTPLCQGKPGATLLSGGRGTENGDEDM